ncbi:hypothetical protein D3C78_1555210 [compost metagenome]
MKLTVDWLFSRPDGGNDTVFTVKATVTVTPGAMLPKGTPVEGLTPVRGTPSTSTLPDTNVVPAGRASVNTALFTVSIPLLVIAMEYVMVSPTVVDVVVVDLTTATLGEETGIVIVLDRIEPPSVRPSGSVKL